MATIYQIIGGGQRVRQISERGNDSRIEIIKITGTDLPKITNRTGQDAYTGFMWSTNLEELKQWAIDWILTENYKINFKLKND